jgi:hypothetical protein
MFLVIGIPLGLSRGRGGPPPPIAGAVFLGGVILLLPVWLLLMRMWAPVVVSAGARWLAVGACRALLPGYQRGCRWVRTDRLVAVAPVWRSRRGRRRLCLRLTDVDQRTLQVSQIDLHGNPVSTSWSGRRP